MIKEIVLKRFAVIFALAVLVFGLFTTATEAVRLYEDNAFFENASEASAICTYIEQNASSRISGAVLVDLNLKYNGTDYSIKRVKYSGEISVGQSITAYILPENPKSCRLERIGFKRLAGGIAILLMGIIASVFGSMNFRDTQKKD